MKTTIDTYPVFDANQVLTNDHLNMVVDYLEEQERLTRANLIGIGISCGLALTMDGAAGRAGFTRGCAVTSLGYLVVEPGDVALTGYREYQLPEGDAYAPFMDGDEQLPLWELFPDGEPDVTLLTSPANFLSGKAVLLFVERDDEDLSDCSPSNCDDKGSEVTVTVRRLLVKVSDLGQISATLAAETSAAARLALPTLRLHRYDTPASGPVSTREILVAFQDLAGKDEFVTLLAKALQSAYAAFKPILVSAYPTDPFSSFHDQYGFLESTPTEPRQVKFLQYYTDLLADVVAAYDEFRRKGLELTCLCCPPDDWFPRHVVLGPQQRTAWYPASAAGCGCEPLRAEVQLLFQRLVQMTLRFTDQPDLAKSSGKDGLEGQIVITPSRAGVAPLSERCIPYYYAFTGSPKLYELWNPALTAAGKADHNLAYRSWEYATTPPAFVSRPLFFDLEPFDFFRIEGHLGLDYRVALATLLLKRDALRLPFDVVVARTGDVDDSVKVDPRDHECRFQDLEAAYDVLRAELTCLAKKAFTSLGQVKPSKSSSDLEKSGTAPASKTSKSANVAPALAAQNVMGIDISEVASAFAFDVGSIGQILISNVQDWGQFEIVHPGLSVAVNTAVSVLSKLIQLTSSLAADLYLVDWDAFDAICSQLDKLSKIIAKEAASGAQDGLSWQELNQQLVSVVYACRIEGFRSLRDEYERRLEELRALTFFSSYAQRHPALQHKAGVPVGGTFLLVYHGKSKGVSSQPGVYEKAIGQLAEGTVVADFFLPYRCCSDCAPIQYVIKEEEAPPQVEPPVITATVGCTSAKDGAEVKLTIAGGTAPYALVVGGVSQGSSTGTATIQLFGGSYTVQATDADGQSATPITVIVPEALAAGTVSFADDAATGTFTASFTVSGGIGPYATSAGKLVNDVVILDGQKSGTVVNVVITDSAGCAVAVAVEHKLVAPPVITATMGCTTAKDGATVKLVITGGTPPYVLVVGNQSLGSTDGAAEIQLFGGSFTVQATDADGQGATPITVIVPQVLSAGTVSFVDDAATGTFTASFKLTGGLKPYATSAGKLDSDVVSLGGQKSGAGVDVLVTDSAGCTVTVSFEHKVAEAPPQAKPPVITATMGCTTAKDGAAVKLTITGGTAPYVPVVDGQAQGASQGTTTVKLFGGSHTVQATDAAGLSATPLTVIVPAALAAGTIGFVDDAAAGTFTASFKLTGGLKPYATSAGKVDNDVVSLGGQKSGAGVDVLVTDSAGCTLTVPVEHTVEKDCDKPCDGKALRAHYAAWAPRPAPNTSYAYKAIKTWTVEIKDENGLIILSEDFAAQASAVALTGVVTESTYGPLMTKICAAVSTAIDARLSAEFGERAFVIEFDAPSGTLLLERYTCHPFVSEIEFVLSGKVDSRSEHWTYTPDAVKAVPLSEAAGDTSKMPLFGGIDLDKCANTEGKDCTVAVKSIVAEKSGEALLVKLNFGQDADVKDFAFFWRLETPAVVFSTKPELKLPALKISFLRTAVLVIEKKTGCWFYGEKTFVFAAGTDTPIG